MDAPGSKEKMLNLSQYEHGILSQLRLFQIAGLCAAAFGLLGIIAGLYSVFFRTMAPVESIIVKVLILNSCGIIIFSLLFYIMSRFVEKFKKFLNL